MSYALEMFKHEYVNNNVKEFHIIVNKHNMISIFRVYEYPNGDNYKRYWGVADNIGEAIRRCNYLPTTIHSLS